MSLLYYELGDYYVQAYGGKYFRYKTKPYERYNSAAAGPMRAAYISERIWRWDPETDTVEYVKHRHTGIETPVDRKEFALIQIRAEDY